MSYQQYQQNQQNPQYQQYQQYPQYRPVRQKTPFLRNPKFMPWSPLVFWAFGAVALMILSFIGTLFLVFRAIHLHGEVAGWLLILSPILGAILGSSVAILSNIIPVIMCIINLFFLRKVFPPISSSQKALIITLNIFWAVIAIILFIATVPYSAEMIMDYIGMLL